MDRRRLYLHIGTQKTGTSSFQRYLLDHRDQLRTDGSHVITDIGRNGKPTASLGAYADTILRPTLRTGFRMRNPPPSVGHARRFVRVARRVRASVLSANVDRAVFSAEALCLARTPAERWRVRLLARACDADIVTVLCLRDLAAWRASWEAQVRKWRDAVDPGEGTDNILGDWYYDVDAITAFWSGLGELRVVDYDRSLATDGSVIPALLRACDSPAGASGDYWLNRR
jgi:hypothetical protein